MEHATPEQRILTVCVLILTALAISAALYLFSGVLIPFVLAVFLTYCFTPVIEAQVRWLRLPRMVAILTTILVGIAALFLIGLLVAAAVSETREHADDYRGQIDHVISTVADSLPLERLGMDDLADPGAAFLGLSSNTLRDLFTGTVSGVMSVLSKGTLVVIFMIFMIAGRGTADVPPGSVWYEIETQTKRYLLTMIFISGITGVLVGLTLSLLGVQFAWMFGFLTFLLNFIPNIGSVIATLLPVPVVLLSPELSTGSKIAAIAIPAGIQFTIGNIVQPKVMGRSLDLHPVTVLMSLIFFGIIWGIVGMFLATPITAIIRMLLERFEYTRPIASVLAGRFTGPAPPPAAPARDAGPVRADG